MTRAASDFVDHHGSQAPEDDALLADLTDPQRQAVLHTEGPLLVVAAAGSGKTRTITRRIAHLVRVGIPPWSILALTFTNKAAAEMRERVMSLLGEDSRATRGLTVTTFHSLCARLLRRYAEIAKLPGLKPDFTIYDSGDQTAMMKKTLEALELSTTNWPPRSVLSAISTAKNGLMDAAAYGASVSDFSGKTIAKIYASYEQALRKANAVDFDDLLLLTARMLRQSREVREECQNRWQYLLIDEYQDTNRAQFVIASLLAGEGRTGEEGARSGPNICVVGDPDQAIYGWRGADLTNILDFERQYSGCRVITLGENFRSTAPILAVADTLIRNNKQRRHKDLFTRMPGGEKVEMTLCRDEQQEATLVVDWLRRLHGGAGEANGGIPWRDMAVFYRTNALSRVMEDAMRAAAIPYVIARGTSFFQREEVKNAISYLRVVANQADDVSLLRVINTPTRGIGAASLKQVEAFASHHNLPIFPALQHVERVPGISPRARNSMQKFEELVNGWTGSGSFMGAGITGSLADLVERIIKESGLEKMYKDQAKAGKSEADLERPDNLDELISSAKQFELEYDPSGDPALEAPRNAENETPPLLALLRGYLESISLVADADAVDPAQGAVTLMTLHAAKGLEFPAAAMIGLEEGLLPHSRARESEAELEEERRLCFVGITRAMRRLHITSAKYRTVRGISERTIPSRFLGEVGRENVLVSDQSDALGDLDQWADGVGFSEGQTRYGYAGGRRAGGSGGGGRSGAGAKFPVGTMVRHPQFGVGKVVSITTGANARAEIQFRDVGKKTLVLEYARLERV